MKRVEVERRYRADEAADEYVSRLESCGFVLIEECIERDLYYNSPARDFLTSKECLRIRDKNDRTTLTWKPPTEPELAGSGYYAKEELDIDVSRQSNAVQRLLDVLGFNVCAVVEKHRRTFEGPTEVRAFLDEVSGVGTFIELEVITHDTDLAIRNIESAAADLKLCSHQIDRVPYRDLVIAATQAGPQAVDGR